MQAIDLQLFTPAEYLAAESVAEFRSEYLDGEIVPMTGGSVNHNRITLNISTTLNFLLKRQPYDVFVNDLRLWIPARNIYTYPDIMVVAGNLEYPLPRTDTIANPILIVEVLSPSTQNSDRGEKFDFYRTIPSFSEYLLVSQTQQRAMQFVKQSDRKWLLTEYQSEDAIDLALSLIHISEPTRR
jgi:Uma2 family endonuclease